MAKGVKTGGRAAGVPNKATVEFRRTITELLDKNAANVGLWLERVATGNGDPEKADPGKALQLLAQLAEYGAPKLARTEVSHSGSIETTSKEQRDAAVAAATRADR